MATKCFDIFERRPEGKPNWVECVDDLLEARHRVSELRLLTQRQYFIYDEVSGAFEEATNDTMEETS